MALFELSRLILKTSLFKIKSISDKIGFFLSLPNLLSCLITLLLFELLADSDPIWAAPPLSTYAEPEWGAGAAWLSLAILILSVLSKFETWAWELFDIFSYDAT